MRQLLVVQYFTESSFKYWMVECPDVQSALNKEMVLL